MPPCSRRRTPPTRHADIRRATTSPSGRRASPSCTRTSTCLSGSRMLCGSATRRISTPGSARGRGRGPDTAWRAVRSAVSSSASCSPPAAIGGGRRTMPARGPRHGAGIANSADTADRRRGGSRAARAGRRGASSSDRPDRRRGRGRTPADSRRGRSARTGASPRVLAGDPQGRGHARGLVRLMGCGKGWIASPRFGPRVRRGRASGPSPSRRPGGNRSTLRRPAGATSFVLPSPTPVQNSALSGDQRHSRTTVRGASASCSPVPWRRPCGCVARGRRAGRPYPARAASVAIVPSTPSGDPAGPRWRMVICSSRSRAGSMITGRQSPQAR